MFKKLFNDSLVVETQKLLDCVVGVTKAMNQKRDIIIKAEEAINEAQEAIKHAKQALSIN